MTQHAQDVGHAVCADRDGQHEKALAAAPLCQKVSSSVRLLNLFLFVGCTALLLPKAAATPPSAPSTHLSPRYHLNDGPFMQSDPSGCIEINGTWFVFPDILWPQRFGSVPGSVYTSTDLTHWVRRPTNLIFQETGGIGVRDDGFAVTFGSGFRFTDLKKDPMMSSWHSQSLGDGDPHVAHGDGMLNVFRSGDPARPFKYKGDWFVVLGAGKNVDVNSTYTPMSVPCELCENAWVQGELRLFKAADATLTDWRFVNTIFASNRSVGEWAARLPNADGSGDVRSVANMFECPDFFPIGDRWMFITSKILQGTNWATGGNHHWDEYYIGTFDGYTFTPDLNEWSTGVLDYGYVAAGKTGGNVANDPMGRRVFFGWNMPWSRQGWKNGKQAEGPWLGRNLKEGQSDAPPPVWPIMEAFGSQVLPRDLSLFPDGTLKMVPVPELSSLRKPPSAATHYHGAALKRSVACTGVKGTQLELNFTISVGTGTGAAAGASVSVLASPDGRERTLIGCNATHLIVNQMNSTLTPDLTPEELAKVKFFWNNAAVSNHTILYAPLPTRTTHNIRVFLDGYNLEVFADERVAITTNVFPVLSNATCVGVDVSSAAAEVSSLDVWAMNPAPITGMPYASAHMSGNGAAFDTTLD